MIINWLDMAPNLTPMDNVRAALLNALVEGMTLHDVWLMAEHAKTTDDLDRAVNVLANTLPQSSGF